MLDGHSFPEGSGLGSYTFTDFLSSMFTMQHMENIIQSTSHRLRQLNQQSISSQESIGIHWCSYSCYEIQI